MYFNKWLINVNISVNINVFCHLFYVCVCIFTVAMRKSRSSSCGIKEITERVFSKKEDSIRQEEWRIAAYIVNRFFAWLYLFTTVLTFFVVFFNAPRTKEGTLWKFFHELTCRSHGYLLFSIATHSYTYYIRDFIYQGCVT